MDDSEPDYHNFSQTPSSHRLPTLNGAQALLDAIEKHRPIPTNLPTLDSLLCESSIGIASDGGVTRGVVTEIYGPPGSGKTHFAIQLAANALRQSDSAQVVWIDTASKLPYLRLDQFLTAPVKAVTSNSDTTRNADGDVNGEARAIDERFTHLHIANFTHLLSILMHPPRHLIPERTCLLVVDDFSAIVTNGLPQDERFVASNSFESNTSLSRDDIVAKSVAVRRAAMVSSISAGLVRLAASLGTAIVVLNNATSTRKSGSKIATMKSVLNFKQWNENTTARIVLYRMFWPRIDLGELSRAARRKQRRRRRHALRVAEVERVGGKEVHAEGIKFVILTNRLQSVDPPKSIEILDAALPSSPPIHSEDNEEAMGNLELDDSREDEDQSVRMPEDMPASSVQATSQVPKRKIGEIADSEDEDDLEAFNDAKRPSNSRPITGFLPSSQLSMEDNESTIIDYAEQDKGGGTSHESDDFDEMLIKN